MLIVGVGHEGQTAFEVSQRRVNRRDKCVARALATGLLVAFASRSHVPVCVAVADRGAHALIRQALTSSGDIIPGDDTLTIRLDPLNSPRQTKAIGELCDHLTATHTRYPSTDLVLRYEVIMPGATTAPVAGQQLFSLREDFDHTIIDRYLKVGRRAGLEVCGIAFIEAEDGRVLTYDVNTNTNYNAVVEAAALRPAGRRRPPRRPRRVEETTNSAVRIVRSSPQGYDSLLEANNWLSEPWKPNSL